MFCPECGSQVGDASKFCGSCGNAMQQEALPSEMPGANARAPLITNKKTDLTSESTDASTQASLLKRYRDGYRVADAIVMLGALVKFIGALLAVTVVGVLVLLSYSARNLLNQNKFGQFGNVGTIGVGVPELLILAVPAVMLFFFFWIIGVIISGQGQMIRASIDAAVNTSPFLSNDTRARIMRL